MLIHHWDQIIILFKLILFSSTVVASQPIEDSTCELTSKDQSCSTATSSTAATPQAQDFSGQTSKSLLHDTPIKKKQRKVIRAQVQKIRRLRKTLQKKSSLQKNK